MKKSQFPKHDEFQKIWQKKLPRFRKLSKMLKIEDQDGDIEAMMEQVAWEIFLAMRPQRN